METSSASWWMDLSQDHTGIANSTQPTDIINDLKSHAFWENYRDEIAAIPNYVFYGLGIFIGIVGLIGTVGNILVIYIFCSTKYLRTPPNMFIVNLAFSDMAFSVINGFPLMTISAFSKRWIFGSLACELYGFMGGVFGLASINTLAWISVDRYVVISKPFYALRYCTHKRVALQLVAVWGWALIWSAPPLLGWGSYIPEGFQIECSFDYLTRTTENMAFVLCLFFCGFAIPVLVIIYCYANIVRAVSTQRKAMSQLAENIGGQQDKERKKFRTELRLAKIAAGTIALFLISWVPYAAVSQLGIWGLQQYVTPYTCQFPVMLAKASAMWNPIVYAISHPKFRAALYAKMPWLVVCKGSNIDQSANYTEEDSNTVATTAKKTTSAAFQIVEVEESSGIDTELDSVEYNLYNEYMAEIAEQEAKVEGSHDTEKRMSKRFKSVKKSIKRSLSKIKIMRKEQADVHSRVDGPPKETKDGKDKEEVCYVTVTEAQEVDSPNISSDENKDGAELSGSGWSASSASSVAKDEVVESGWSASASPKDTTDDADQHNNTSNPAYLDQVDVILYDPLNLTATDFLSHENVNSTARTGIGVEPIDPDDILALDSKPRRHSVPKHAKSYMFYPHTSLKNSDKTSSKVGSDHMLHVPEVPVVSKLRRHSSPMPYPIHQDINIEGIPPNGAKWWPNIKSHDGTPPSPFWMKPPGRKYSTTEDPVPEESTTDEGNGICSPDGESCPPLSSTSEQDNMSNNFDMVIVLETGEDLSHTGKHVNNNCSPVFDVILEEVNDKSAPKCGLTEGHLVSETEPSIPEGHMVSETELNIPEGHLVSQTEPGIPQEHMPKTDAVEDGVCSDNDNGSSRPSLKKRNKVLDLMSVYESSSIPYNAKTSSDTYDKIELTYLPKTTCKNSRQTYKT